MSVAAKRSANPAATSALYTESSGAVTVIAARSAEPPMLGEMSATSIVASKTLRTVAVTQTASSALPVLGNTLRSELKALTTKA